MKKRILALFCAIAIVLNFSACKNENETVVTTDIVTTTLPEISEVTTTVTEEITTTQTVEEVTNTTTTTAEITTAVETTETEETTATTTTEVTTTVATTTAETTTSEVTTSAETTAVTATTTEEKTTEAVRPAVSATGLSDMTTMDLVQDMGVGINLGNTYEACGDWIKQWGDGTPESYETAWGSPVITEQIIKGYADAGFGVLRVPVAWSNMMNDDYTISCEYAEEVKEVVDWALEYDLYVIVNLHYDNGWLEKFPVDKENCMKKYSRIWEQVSEIFMDYDERLMFESQNEELGWSSVWNPYGGTTGKYSAFFRWQQQ